MSVMLTHNQQLGLIKSSLWVQILVQFLYMLLFLECLLQLGSVLTQHTLTTYYYRILLYIIIIGIQFPLYFNNQRKFIDITPKQDKLFSTSLSVQFILQLAAFYGSEFIGSFRQQYNQDFSYLTQPSNVTQKQTNEISKLIGQCEQQLEDFKLLYENIYANIFLNYAMCGQTIEYISLFDIEEALPIPLLLEYLRAWKTPDQAYSSILYYLKQISILEKVKNDDSPYNPIHPLDCFTKYQQQQTNLQKILRNNCIKQSILLNDHWNKDELDQKDKRNNSINPELALFKNNYQFPSPQKFAGGLFLVEAQDINNYKFLFQHVLIQSEDFYYVFIPTLSQLSSITGNLHRLSFNNIHISSSTQNLRQIRLFALISLARIMFPLKQQIDGKFKLPLTSSFLFYQYQQSRILSKLKYGNPFILKLFVDNLSYNSKKLYEFSPYLLSQQQSNNDAQLLQFVLVEYFLTRIVTTQQSTPRLYKFLNIYYNQHYKFIHKLMTYQEQEFDYQEVCTIPNMLTLNALIIQFSSAIIDKRATSLQNVVNTLILNRSTYMSRHSNCSYKSWIRFQKVKLDLQLKQLSLTPEFSNEIVKALSYLTELDQYQQFVDQLEQSIQERHMNIINEVSKFIFETQQIFYKLINIQSQTNINYTRTICLLQNFQDQENQQDWDEQDVDQRINLDSCFLIHDSELHYHRQIFRQVQFYNFIRLSNLIYYLQINLAQHFTSKKNMNRLHKDGSLLDNSMIGLSTFIDFLQQDIVKQQIGISYECSINTCSSSSSSFSDVSDEDSIVEDDKSYLNTDINLNNPWKFEDDFSLINANYYFIDSDNILKLNHQPDQNTPEFLISVLKQDFKIIKNPSIKIYQHLVHLLTALHDIKIQDNTTRAKNSTYFIVPRLYNIQLELEQLVQRLFKQIQEIKQSSCLNYINKVQLDQVINSINLIENQIIRLFNAKSLLLKRQFITQDQFLTIKLDILRSFDLTYGYPTVEIANQSIDQKQKLILICEAYCCENEKISQQLFQQSLKLPRCGGCYSFNSNYRINCHSSWKEQFLWEKNIDTISAGNIEIASPDNSSKLKTSKPVQQVEQLSQKFPFYKKNYFFSSIIALFSIFTLLFVQYFYTNNNLPLNSLQESNLQLSSAIFGLQNMFDDINIVSQRYNFNSLENSSYLTFNFNKYRQSQESLLKSFIYTNAIYKKTSFANIYTQIVNTNIFGTNYSAIHNQDTINFNYCSVNIGQLDADILQHINLIIATKPSQSKIAKDIFYNITSEKITNIKFKKLNLMIPYYRKGFVQQKFLISVDNDIIPLNLVQAQLFYIYQSSCLLQTTMHYLYSGKSQTESQVILNKVEDKLMSLQNSYIQSFDFIFNQQLQTMMFQNELLIKLFLMLYIFVVLAVLFIQQVIYIQYQSKNLVICKLDKGSIISQLLQLPKELLKTIKNKYRLATKLTTKISDYQCIFDVEKKITILSSVKTNLTPQLEAFQRMLKPFLVSVRVNKFDIFTTLILVEFALKTISTIVLIIQISPQFQYDQLQTYNSYINDDPYYFKKPSIVGKISTYPIEIQQFYNYDNDELKNLAKQLQLPKISNYKCIMDTKTAISQILVDYMWIQTWYHTVQIKEQADDQNNLQSLINILPFYELLRLKHQLVFHLHIQDNNTLDIYGLFQEVNRLIEKYPTLNTNKIEYLFKYQKPAFIPLEASLNQLCLKIHQYRKQIQLYNYKVFQIIIETLLLLINFYQLITLFYILIVYMLKINLNQSQCEEFQIIEYNYIKKMIFSNYSIICYCLIMAFTIVSIPIQLYYYCLYFYIFVTDQEKYSYQLYVVLGKILEVQTVFQSIAALIVLVIFRKALYVLASLGYPEEYQTLTIQEDIKFPQVLEDTVAPDQPYAQQFIYESPDFIFPYPVQDMKSDIYDQIVYFTNIVFVALTTIIIIFVCYQNTANLSFFQLARFQHINNMISTQSLGYYTHSNDYIIQTGVYQNLVSEQRDIQLFLKNSDVSGAYLYKQFIKDSHYNNPTYYLFIDQIQDSQFEINQGNKYNQANYNTSQVIQPSILYGITNMSRYLQLQPPRLYHFGIHILDDVSKFQLQSTIQGTLKIESNYQQNSLSQITKNLQQLAKTMTPGGQFGQNGQFLTQEESVVFLQTQQRQVEFWSVNRANNREISIVIQDSIQYWYDHHSNIIIILLLLIVCIFILVLILSQILIKKIQSYVLKTSLFTSLFLKRFRGVKEEKAYGD
ncbi:Transmembrane domain-containing protein [Spironucleus salmonicida]|nr:Transmembrane domain-containing protein [Spironucleus salmonicida]